MDILNMILPIVYIVVGCALVWFLVELVLTIRKARTTVDSVQKELEPTLANVKQITDQVVPVMERVDPLVEHVSLTVDAANLEIMRVDEILQDVTQITNTASKAIDTVDNVTSAPLDLVNSFANKVRKRFSPQTASAESEKLGELKAKEDEQEQLNHASGQVQNAMLKDIDDSTSAMSAETESAPVDPYSDPSVASDVDPSAESADFATGPIDDAYGMDVVFDNEYGTYTPSKEESE